jgi:hypothetical protein
MAKFTFRKVQFVRPNYDKPGSDKWSKSWKGYMKFWGELEVPGQVDRSGNPRGNPIAGFCVSIVENGKGLEVQRRDRPHEKLGGGDLLAACHFFVRKYEGRVRELFKQERLKEDYPFKRVVEIGVEPRR